MTAREVIARTDTATLLAAMQAMERGDYEAAGRILRNPAPVDAHALALRYDPRREDAYLLEVLELGADGSARLRTTRELDSWDGQALWDELRLRTGPS